MPQKETKKPITLKESYPYILIIGGAIGLFSAAKLTLEKINLLENPDAQLSCDLNPVIACGSVINTDQASAFNFPNPFLGIAGFAVVVTIGMGLLAGAKYKRWFWNGLELGTVFGVIFVHWLMYQSLYNIQALCPYCMVVWSVTIPLFWYTTLYNLRYKNIRVSKKYSKAVDFMQRHHAEILLVWFIIILFLILNRFWYYWSTLI